MSSVECWKSGRLLGRRQSGLSDGQRIALERHVAACRDCRDDEVRLDEMTRLIGGVLGLSTQARERAMKRAFLQAALEADEPRGFFARHRPFVFGLSTVAVGCAVAVLVLRGSGAPDAPKVALTSVAQPAAKASPAANLPTLPEGKTTFVKRGAELALAHAKLRVVRSGKLTWDAKHARVEIGEASVDVEVDPAPGKPFAVTNPSFAVEVLGTRFLVKPDEVEVKRGAVRIMSSDGEILRERLTAGESWSIFPPVDTATFEPSVVTAPERPSARPSRSFAGRLAQARHQLAAGNAVGARREAEDVLGVRPDRRDEAEARTILAECAQVSGDLRRAMSGYADVVRRFGDLPAGETALFAAGRLAAQAGHDDAQRWLRLYLARYPSGRFQPEATARLRELGK